MNNNNELKTLSKFLSLVLRHEPERIGLVLDEAGWVSTADLLDRLARAGRAVTFERLQQVVAGNDKQRFALSEDGQRIRANQGHSVAVDLGLIPADPPTVLYHGTATRFLTSILEQGLLRGARHHVHLSEDRGGASQVGSRYGQLALLRVDAQGMRDVGHVFYRADNGVWLTDAVPPNFLELQP